MKKIWPSVACSAVLLSGCMYGSATAPITALNQQPPGQQYQQPGRAPVGQIQVRPGQTVALTPTRVQPQRPAIAVPPAQPRPPQQIQPPPVAAAPVQPGIVTQAASPYAQPAVAQPYAPQNNSSDGWSVSPQQTQAPGSVTPVQATEVASAQPQVNTGEAQPVRPPQPQADSNNTTSPVNTAATQSNSAATTQQQQVASATPPPQQPAAPAQGETAVSALLKKASASLGKGDLDGAAAYLENAQRIEPQNVKILYDIANIRYHQGRYKDAESFAGRAVQAGGSNSMMKKSWALVANARKSLGDNQGAIAAAEKAASFGN